MVDGQATTPTHANLVLKLRLQEFWGMFGGWKARGDYSGHSSKDKLTALREMASFVVPFKRQQAIRERRQNFNAIKSSICRQKIGSPCFVCGTPGFSRHHVVQLQNGGINSRRNVVILCDPCHAEIHPWLRP